MTVLSLNLLLLLLCFLTFTFTYSRKNLQKNPMCEWVAKKSKINDIIKLIIMPPQLSGRKIL